MDSRKIINFINKANRRLKMQFLAKTLQIAVSLGLAAALLILVFSRLSIFPYYGFYAYSTGVLVILSIMLWSIRKIPRRGEAIAELDKYTPHNQLLTLSQLPAENRLAADLAAKTEKEIHLSYQLFKDEKNEWFFPKWLLMSLGLAVLLLISGLFPSSTQLAAQENEQEQELIEEMIEKVEKQKEQATTPAVKKELEKLEQKLAESEMPEQALRELVKKQKELELQKQKKLQDGTTEANNDAEDLSNASAELAEQAGSTQTALSEMGKPVAFDLQQSIAANDATENSQESGAAERESEGAESASNAEGEQGEAAGSESSGSSGGSNGEKGSEHSSGEGETEGAGEGQGEGQSEGGSGSADGEGTSAGQGGGQGSGTGQGAGTGQGSRELLSIPTRIGGTGETTIDNGELTEGETGSFEEGPVNAERGTIRPYREVVGSYSDSYFSSAERMKLPPDLQSIVEQYFSSIESE